MRTFSSNIIVIIASLAILIASTVTIKSSDVVELDYQNVFQVRV